MSDHSITSAPLPRPGGLAARAQAAPAAGYLAGLNPEQRQAVEATDGPVLVLAGAGTGKTRVLTTRIAHLIATNRAFPSQILSVTFTNKAAREMKERIGHLVGAVAEGMPWLGTFHSISAKILRRHAELLDLRSDFTILDTDDQIRLMKQVIQAEGIDEKRWPARMLSGFIDSWKNRGLAPKDVAPGEAAVFANGKGGTLYAAYQDRLKTLNAVDFGDLLLHCLTLFREHADVLASITSASATSSSTSIRTPTRRSISGCGCSPRGAQHRLRRRRRPVDLWLAWRRGRQHPALRARFSGRHGDPARAQLPLDRHILATAAKLIARNESRLGKTLRTEDELGEKVTITGAWDSQEEARLITDEIEAMQLKGENLAEIAVLVRISAQMRELEERFVQTGVPYRVIGGPRFYERAEIRDAMAYLRCVVSPTDDLAFERIVNVPKRGLGDATIQILHNHARATGFSLLQSARAIVESDELKPKARTSCANWSRPSAAGRSAPSTCPRANSPNSCWRRAATPRCGRRTARPTPQAGSKT